MNEVVHHHTVEPEIHFSEAAIKHIVSYLQKNKDHQGIRLAVKKRGCSGWSYEVDYVKEPKKGDMLMSLSGDYWVCIDRTSYPFLRNVQVDYVRQGLNYKFIFTNPNQTGQCGCGESFTVN